MAVIADDQENSYGGRAVCFWVAEVISARASTAKKSRKEKGKVQQGKAYVSVKWFKATAENSLVFKDEDLPSTDILADSLLFTPGLAWTPGRVATNCRRMTRRAFDIAVEAARAEFKKSVEPYLTDDEEDDMEFPQGAHGIGEEDEGFWQGRDDEEDEIEVGEWRDVAGCGGE